MEQLAAEADLCVRNQVARGHEWKWKSAWQFPVKLRGPVHWRGRPGRCAATHDQRQRASESAEIAAQASGVPCDRRRQRYQRQLVEAAPISSEAVCCAIVARSCTHWANASRAWGSTPLGVARREATNFCIALNS